MGRSERSAVPKAVPEVIMEGQHTRPLNSASRRKRVQAGFYNRLFHLLRVLERDDGKV
jgi:hypothetical protein